MVRRQTMLRCVARSFVRVLTSKSSSRLCVARSWQAVKRALTCLSARG